jgi:ADP-ribose pyrophosphatase YjhB (NUDIX family)
VSDYDRERYRRIEEIAAEMASLATGVEPERVIASWSSETGYVTPKVGLVAAIHDESGRVLLLRRPDTGLWSLPAGFAEVGESPARGIVREVREETGLVVVPRWLLGIYDAWLHGSANPHHIYTVVFVCDRVGGVLERTPEALALGYFGADDLPEVTKSHRRAIEDALDAGPARRGEASFDPAD